MSLWQRIARRREQDRELELEARIKRTAPTAFSLSDIELLERERLGPNWGRNYRKPRYRQR